MLKHTIPGDWMGTEEKSLNWRARFEAQILRRWFEMGNDLVWVSIGLLNCFVLTGGLAALAPYVTVTGFAFDVVNASLRAYIELNRLDALRAKYAKMADYDRQRALDERINFEKMRFALNITGATTILLAMSLAIPAFALSPLALFASAAFLLLLWAIMFALSRTLDAIRPKDVLELQPNTPAYARFFSAKPSTNRSTPPSKPIDDKSSPPSPVFI